MNFLKMDLQQSILRLTEQGWSQRKIARELEIDRETVARYRRLAKEAEQAKPAIAPAGSSAESAAVPTPKPAISPPGKPGRRSECEPWRQPIIAKLEAGLSAQRIYQDLVAEHGFTARYDSVKRFVRNLEAGTPLPFRRMESAPGEEAQVDFGLGAWIVEEGKRRRPYLFRVVLSFSRKAYAEVFYRQTTENFIRGLENAFRHFGGVPLKLVPDNLRAAVKKADWFEPELNPKVVSFCEHYGCVILPTKPGIARHKGKVEAGVKYVQSNALAGRSFSSLSEQNQFLAQWERDVADTRIHGTTRQQVRHHFQTLDQPALRPLPPDIFPVFSEAPRKVHRDGYVEVAKAYYSAPPEYVGRQVWARWDTALVRLFNTEMKPLAVHPRRQPGAFETLDEHVHSHKRCIVERGVHYMLNRCALLGSDVARWSQAMYDQRGVEGLRVLQGLLSLAETYTPKQLNQACRAAFEQAAWRLRQLKALLPVPSTQQQTMSFMHEHPLIRPLTAYQQYVPEDPFAAQDATTTDPNLNQRN